MEDEEQEQPAPATPAEESPVQKESPVRTEDFLGTKPKKKSPLGPITAVIIIIILIGVAFFFIRGRGEEELSTDSVFSTEQPTSTFAPSPTPAVSREETKLEILNGTGIAGEAGFLKGKLEAAGFSDIEVGNAGTQDNTTTKVSFGSGVPASLRSEIKTLLEATYESVDETTGTSGMDIRVTTGLRRGQTPKPTATATPESSPTATPTATPTESPSPSPTATQ